MSQLTISPITAYALISQEDPGDELVRDIEKTLTAIAQGSIRKEISKGIPDLFRLRMRLLSRFLDSSRKLLAQAKSNITKEIASLRKKEHDEDRLTLLNQFEKAWTISYKVTSSIVHGQAMPDKEDLRGIEEITYDRFLLEILLSPAPAPVREKFVELTEQSLTLEFALLISYFALVRRFELSSDKLKELAEVLLYASTYYGDFWNSLAERLEPALLSESSLSKDWLKPEEDEAWKDL